MAALDGGGAPLDLRAPTFELEPWASNYDGLILPYRLLHVALHCPPLARPALTLALQLTKSAKDVRMHSSLVTTASLLGLEDLAVEDGEWMAKQDEANRRELARLESELRGYKNNLIRESIRMGQEDLATHLLATGGPQPDPTAGNTGYGAAQTAFTKMREFCTTPAHIASMTLRLVHASVLQAVQAQSAGGSAATHWNTVLAHAGRLRNVGVKEEEQARLTPLSHAATGLAHLSTSSYHAAAQAFLAITPESYSSRALATPHDLAIYGTLTALATFPPASLATALLSPPFRPLLDLEPPLRKAVASYLNANYPACLKSLRAYYADWSLDVFLGASAAGGGSHVDALLARIRQNSLIAHVAAFSAVRLDALAATFPPLNAAPGGADLQAMEREVVALLQAGLLQGGCRVDVVRGLVVREKADEWRETCGGALGVAEGVERGLRARLHAVNVVLAGLEVAGRKGRSGGEDAAAWV